MANINNKLYNKDTFLKDKVINQPMAPVPGMLLIAAHLTVVHIRSPIGTPTPSSQSHCPRAAPSSHDLEL